MTPSSSESPGRRRAESVFFAHMAEHGSMDDVELAALCANEPDVAAEVRRLRSAYEIGVACCRDALVDEAEGGAPACLDRYTILEEIGRGGMGVVRRAWDRELRRVVAIKSLRPTGSADSRVAPILAERARARLREEAQVLGQLQHPGVLPLHDLGLDEHGELFFTMPVVNGEDYAKIIARAHDVDDDSWSLTRAVATLQRVAETMAFAHSRGVLHRDLKPSNIMVGEFGESFVMDWGLAKVLGRATASQGDLLETGVGESTNSRGDESGSTVSTDRQDLARDDPLSPLASMPGQVVGTPSYMPPEQAAGDTELDVRADVYALGATLYHLLAGHAPYRKAAAGPGEAVRDVTLARVCSEAPTSLHRVAPDVPIELVAICERAMHRDRESRYASMHEFAADLRAHLELRVVGAHRRGAFVELRKWMQRHRALVWLMAVLFLVLVGSTIGLGLLYKRAEDQRVRANRHLAILRQNPPGDRIDFSLFPGVKSFVQRFDAGLEPPLRPFLGPDYVTANGGRIVIRRHGRSSVFGSFGLDDARAVLRGGFDLRVVYEALDGGKPEIGQRFWGMNVRRVRDGACVALIQHHVPAESSGQGPEYVAAQTSADLPATRAKSGRVGGLRIVQKADRITAYGLYGATWTEIWSGSGTEEELTFSVYVATCGGATDDYRVAFDNLELSVEPPPPDRLLEPIEEAFDSGLPSWLIRHGDTGAVGILDGQLIVETLPNEPSRSTLSLAGRYVLRGDFDLSLELRLVETTESDIDCSLTLFVVATDVVAASASFRPREPLTVSANVGDSKAAAVAPGSRTHLRVQRSGSRLTWSLGDGKTWQPILSGTGPAGDLRMELVMLDTDPPGGAAIAIDDLRVTGLVRRYR